MLGLFCANTIVIAAVKVVFPWSTCPIVPTFTCGFVRSNFCFAIVPAPVLASPTDSHPFGESDSRVGRALHLSHRHRPATDAGAALTLPRLPFCSTARRGGASIPGW